MVTGSFRTCSAGRHDRASARRGDLPEIASESGKTFLVASDLPR